MLIFLPVETISLSAWVWSVYARTVIAKQREHARQMMIAKNRAKGILAKINGIVWVFVIK